MVSWPSERSFIEGRNHAGLSRTQDPLSSLRLEPHVVSMLLGLMLLQQAQTLTALQHQESIPTLSRTLNVYPGPLEEVKATRRQLISEALGRHPVIYLILDDTVLPKRGKKLPQLGFHFASSRDRVVAGHDLVFAALREDFRKRTELAVHLSQAGIGGLLTR